MTESSPDSRLSELRLLVAGATQRLLGSTITVTDEQWAAPSRLPGWSRAQVATHLARQADAFTRLVEGAVTGVPGQMYDSPEARSADIERGAERHGLELQTDLDTSAGRLEQGFERLDRTAAEGSGEGSGGEGTGWSATVELRGGLQIPARLLPLGRLFEVEIHLVDLDVGHEVGQVEPDAAEWLIEWVAFRARLRDEFPRVELRADSGFSTTVGSVGPARVVTGSPAALLGWLTNRLDASAVDGADGLRLPSL